MKKVRTAAKRVAKEGVSSSIRVTKTMSLDQEVYASVKRKCGEEGIAISSLVEELLKAWLSEVD